MDSTTTSAVSFELQQEFWETLPFLDPMDPLSGLQQFGSSTDGSEQIAVNCNTSARINSPPGLQQLGEQAGAAAAMDVEPNPNLPQEHQESVQGEGGAACISRVVDVTSGQNLQRASQGLKVGQSNNSSLEQTTLQPVQFMQHQGQPQGVGVQPNVLITVRGGHEPQYGGMHNNINPALLHQKYQPQHGVEYSKSGFALQQALAQEQNRDAHQQGHQGDLQGVGVQPNVFTTVRGGHQPLYGGMRNNINPALLHQIYQPQHGVEHSKSGFALQQALAQEQNRDAYQQGHQGELQGVGVQPNVLTTVRGGHEPQYGGMHNNINPALLQQKYQPQNGVEHSKNGFALQQAPAQKQNCNSHQQGHQLHSNGTGQQSTNAYNYNLSMEGPSHLGNMSPNIRCVRCGNPTCQFLAYQNLIDKRAYWCQHCRSIFTVPNLGGALGSATPLSNPHSNARNMSSDVIRKQTPLRISQPGQIIDGPVRPQHASSCATLQLREGKASNYEWCGTVQQSKEMQHTPQQHRQQLMRSNTNVQHQRSPELFIPPNQTRGFCQDQPLQQQGYYQNFEPQVANSFPQQPPQDTSFTQCPDGVGCNQCLISNGHLYHVRHDTNLDSMQRLGQQYLQTQQPNNMIPSSTDLSEQQRKNQSSGQQPIAKKGIEVPRKASKEPAHLIGVDKPCQWCHSIKTRFKFFCNKKVEQPRYQCGDCGRHFTFGGRLYHKKLAKGGLMLQYNLIPSSQKSETKKGKSFEESEYNSGDDESDDDEEELLGELTELAEEKKNNVSGDDDNDCSESSDGEEDQEEPADLVGVIKPCKWCRSSNTRFCRSIGRESQLQEYQCDDCSFFLRYDRTSRQVVQDDLEGAQRSNSSRRSRYRLRSDVKQDPAVEP